MNTLQLVNHALEFLYLLVKNSKESQVIKCSFYNPGFFLLARKIVLTPVITTEI